MRKGIPAGHGWRPATSRCGNDKRLGAPDVATPMNRIPKGRGRFDVDGPVASTSARERSHPRCVLRGTRFAAERVVSPAGLSRLLVDESGHEVTAAGHSLCPSEVCSVARTLRPRNHARARISDLALRRSCFGAEACPGTRVGAAVRAGSRRTYSSFGCHANSAMTATPPASIAMATTCRGPVASPWRWQRLDRSGGPQSGGPPWLTVAPGSERVGVHVEHRWRDQNVSRECRDCARGV